MHNFTVHYTITLRVSTSQWTHQS